MSVASHITRALSINATPRSDPDLVAACLAGEPGAWDELVKRYEALVFSMPRRIGLNSTDCEDVFQNVFVKAYQKLATLQDHQCLSAWLMRTAHRESCALLRTRSRDRTTEVDPSFDGYTEDEVDLERQERQAFVQIALSTLGGRCQTLLTALFSTQRPEYAKIAEAVGIPAGSIGPTRARCFKKLEKILRDQGFQADENTP